MVAQLHSLDVTLTMKDGTEIHTVELSINAIFQEVDKCGHPAVRSSWQLNEGQLFCSPNALQMKKG